MSKELEELEKWINVNGHSAMSGTDEYIFKSKLLRKLSELKASEGEWINVDKRLPEHDEEVLLFCKENSDTDTFLGRRDYYLNKYWVIGFDEWIDNPQGNFSITHWMKLPNPPKP